MFGLQKEKSVESIITEQVRIAESKGGSFNEYDAVTYIAPLFILVNPPVAILATVCAEVASIYKKKSSLKEHKMPDHWLQKVSESKDVSKDGLKFLAQKLSKNGSVSVADAVEFLEIERDAKERALKEQEKKKNLQGSGAVSLLERANSEFPGLYSSAIDSFNKSLDVLSDVGETALKFSSKGFDAVKSVLKKN